MLARSTHSATEHSALGTRLRTAVVDVAKVPDAMRAHGVRADFSSYQDRTKPQVRLFAKPDGVGVELDTALVDLTRVQEFARTIDGKLA